jgi:hypothetical protein
MPTPADAVHLPKYVAAVCAAGPPPIIATRTCISCEQSTNGPAGDETTQPNILENSTSVDQTIPVLGK